MKMAPGMMKCPHCQAVMIKGESGRSFVRQMFAWLCLLGGFVSLIFIHWLAGLLLILLALVANQSPTKIWKCLRCATFYPRL